MGISCFCFFFFFFFFGQFAFLLSVSSFIKSFTPFIKDNNNSPLFGPLGKQGMWDLQDTRLHFLVPILKRYTYEKSYCMTNTEKQAFYLMSSYCNQI